MTATSDFHDLLILGNGYSAHLAAIALAPILPISAMVGPPKRSAEGGRADRLAGQHAHSHIFLPRLERELDSIDPELLQMMAAHGYHFVPGSRRLRNDAPTACRRMFATRWQFDDAIESLFLQRVQARHVDASVSGIETEAGRISVVSLSSGKQIPIPRSTLVLDATGTKSPVMNALSRRDDSVIDQPGNVVYITQFFRRPDPRMQHLPDPLIDCPHDFGVAAMMLYPGADGWFSISLAINAEHKPLIRALRDRNAFLEFCRQSPHVAAWIDNAAVEGPNRIFINPRNTWNVDLFGNGDVPGNYLAVGDSLTTMLPTLGANCSFAATHVRIIRDLLMSGAPAYQAAFSRAVHEEQFSFFQRALVRRAAQDRIIPYAQSPQQRPAKRIKRGLRRLLGLDRARIIKQLSDSSSL